MKIDFGAWRQLQQVVPLRCAPCELAVGIGHEHRSMPALAQAQHGEQHLALAAAPVTLGIYME